MAAALAECIGAAGKGNAPCGIGARGAPTELSAKYSEEPEADAPVGLPVAVAVRPTDGLPPLLAVADGEAVAVAAD